MYKKIFSLPLYIGMSESLFYEKYLPFVKQHKEHIADIYLALPVPPFSQSALGTMGSPEMFTYIEELQKAGLEIMAIFNDISLPANLDLLNKFVPHFRPLYQEQKIRKAVIPYIHWVQTGILQTEFPELEIKNTVLNRVRTAQDFWDYALAGYNNINLMTDLLRDQNELLNINKARDDFEKKFGKKVKITILGNEGCEGNCSYRHEHYMYGCHKGKPGNDCTTSYGDAYSKQVCIRHRPTNFIEHLKIASLLPWREEIERVMDLVDVIKLHGRNNIGLLESSLSFIEDYASGAETIPTSYQTPTGTLTDIFKLFSCDEIKLKKWRKYIRNCNFQCWACDSCKNLLQ